jgi:hypothetical protein
LQYESGQANQHEGHRQPVGKRDACHLYSSP